MKKHLLLALSLLLTATSLFAVPARRDWQTKTQPDGTTIVVRQVGDEFYHFWETQDGKIAKPQEDGTFVITNEARPSTENIRQRRISSPMYQTSAIRRGVGTTPNKAPRGVVILANFADDEMQAAHTSAVFDELCNSTNCTVNSYNGENYGSAAQYFADQSNGDYRPVFDVYGPVTLSQNVAYYGTDLWAQDDETGEWYQDEGSDTLAAHAVMEACILANQKYSALNFANYDSDKDGKVDFVYVIYAGQSQADGGAATTIWPHNWSISAARFYGNCKYSADDCKLDGKTIDNYAMSSELSGDGIDGIGTLCHEFGHVIGLPDLYDTDYGTVYEGSMTPGDWDIMDGGCYNGGGHCPPNYDPWQKYFFEWTTPVNLGTEGQNITLKPNGASDYVAYQINSSNKLQTTTTAGEVYYLENRQKSGWDAFVPSSGMLVWKVNFNSTAWSDNEPNNSRTSGAPLHTIVPADGGAQIGDVYEYNESTGNWKKIRSAANDPFPGATNTREYLPIDGHKITEIAKSGEDITFKYNGGAQKTEYEYTVDVEHATTSSASGTGSTGETLKLTITPESGYTLADASCWMVAVGLTDLVYGEGFTYDAATNEFVIENVTDDVTIIAEGKKEFSIQWFANGSLFATTTSAGTVAFPNENPEACEDGKEFVGWCKVADYEDASTAPAFVEAGDAAAEGDKFYAVYAEGGAGGSATTNVSMEDLGDASGTVSGFTFATAKNSGSTAPTYNTNGKDLRIYAKGTVTISSDNEMTKIVFNISAQGKKRLAPITASEGTIAAQTSGDEKVTWTGSATEVTFTVGDQADYGSDGSSKAGQLCFSSVDITAGAGASFSNYSTSCTPAEPCELTGITLGGSAQTEFTTSDTFSWEGLVVTAAYSNCDAKEVAASVSEPDMASAGTKTVTVSYTENEVTKTATYDITVSDPKTYTITWHVGSTSNSETYIENADLVFPTDMEDCSETKVFMGWTAASSVSGDEAPEFVKAEAKVTANADYYAVWATKSEGTGGGSSVGITDELTLASTGVTGNAYTDWEGKTVSSDAVYAGQSAGGYSSIQLRSKNSNSGIITTKSGGKISKVVVEWNSNTADNNKIDIYGKNAAYTSPTELYGSDAGTLLGSITKSQTTELTISSDYEYIGIRSNSGAVYLDKVSITWGGSGGSSVPTYSDYTLTCEGAEIPTIYSVTWYVNGEQYAKQEYNEGSPLILPSAPDDCSSVRIFKGWTAVENYSGSTAPKDLFTSNQGSVNADGVYYAVYADKSGNQGTPTTTTLKMSDYQAVEGKFGVFTFVTTGMAGEMIEIGGISAAGADPQYIAETEECRFYAKNSLTITSPDEMTQIIFTLSEYGKWRGISRVTPSVGTIATQAADDETVVWTGYEKEVTIFVNGDGVAEDKHSGQFDFTSIVISTAKGATIVYNNYSTICPAPITCTLTNITLNTDNVKQNFTTGDNFTSGGLVVIASYSNCENDDVTDMATISAPDLMLEGDQTVTVTYEGKTATYTINVTKPVTYTVRWHVCGEVVETQTYLEGAPLVMPENPGANAGKAFFGWIDKEYTGKDEPTLISADGIVEADADYYAVYK